MSRIKELKQQYPELDVSIIDMLSNFDPTGKNKYLPLMCRVIKEHALTRYTANDYSKYDIQSYWGGKFVKTLGINCDDINDEDKVKFMLYRFLTESSTMDKCILSLEAFMDTNERNIIQDKDLNNYKTVQDIDNVVNEALLLTQNKEMEKHTIRVFENDEWLILRPLVFESSAKYGSNTKWCSTMVMDKSHFYRYWNRATLIYILNKQTNYKVALHKYNDGDDDAVHIWNAADREISWFDVEVPAELFPIIKEEINKNKCNREFCDDELQKYVIKTCVDFDFEEISPIPPPTLQEPESELPSGMDIASALIVLQRNLDQGQNEPGRFYE